MGGKVGGGGAALGPAGAAALLLLVPAEAAAIAKPSVREASESSRSEKVLAVL